MQHSTQHARHRQPRGTALRGVALRCATWGSAARRGTVYTAEHARHGTAQHFTAQHDTEAVTGTDIASGTGTGTNTAQIQHVHSPHSTVCLQVADVHGESGLVVDERIVAGSDDFWGHRHVHFWS